MPVSGSDDFRLSEPDAPNPPQRDKQGRFLAGNITSLKTGLHAKGQLPEVFRQQEAEVQEFLLNSIADDGGGDAIPTRRLSQHQSPDFIARSSG